MLTVDDVLAPDPEPWKYRRHDHYLGVTSERALEVAHRRHLRDLARRKIEVDDWADYPALTVRMPWTLRQQRAAAAWLAGCCALMLAGWFTAPALFGAALVASWPVAWWTVRDLWWRLEAWTGRPFPTPLADARAILEDWLNTEETDQ